MCGIVGKINFNGRPVSKTEIKKMCQTIAHRGPDDEGIWVKGNIGLGHRRLSIIDLSPAGHQPMSNEDETLWLTFNGEIYNFLSLRKRLIHDGHKFCSKTDSEVIIHLWEDYKEKCLQFLRGMFAFALWDDKQKLLFLARDRLGQKPLKYYLDHKCFIFASELKAILVDKAVKKEPDLQAIDYYLTLEAVPAPLTGFKNIKKLPAAHYMIVKSSRLRQGYGGQAKVTIKKYWDLDFSQKINLGEEELKREIIKRLKESVKLRLVADVPVGAFLSGGIDSSSIVAMMTSLGQKKINTFSVGCEDKGYNELDFARLVSKKFHTNHHEIIIEPKDFSLLPKLVSYYEEPYGDPSALPTYLVSHLASQKLKVVLNGDGGDENFAGYPRYQNFAPLSFFDCLPSFIKEKIAKLSCLAFWLKEDKREIIKNIFKKSGLEKYISTYLALSFPLTLKQKMYSNRFAKQIDFWASERKLLSSKQKNLPVLDNILFSDIKFYLGEVLLPKMDIATMANGLECRSPLLDHEFMEFTAKIPPSLKLRFPTTKYIFKKSLETILPPEIIYRKKMGFGFPLGRWLQNEWKKEIQVLLLGKTALIKEYFKQQKVKHLLESRSPGEHHDRKAWRFLMLEFWLQNYFGNR